MQFASMEQEIEKKKKEYYNALMDGQKNRYEPTEKMDKWLLFFLAMLEQAILRLEKKYLYIKEKKSYLNERQQKVLDCISANEPVKIKDIVNALNEFTSYTLKKDMAYLVKEGLIIKIGKARATIYVVNNEKGSKNAKNR